MPSSMFPVYLRLIEASDGGLATALAKGFTILALGLGVLAEIGVKGERGFGCLPCLFTQGDRWLKSFHYVAARINI